MANKIIAFFVEEPTEVEFYKALVNYAREKNQGKLDCSFA